MYYIAVVHKDKDSSHGIHFPDVPGCYSAAESMDEVVRNAREALSLYAEDADLPRPRTIDEIRESGDIGEDLEEGAVLVAVPYIPRGGRKRNANVPFEEGLLAAIDQRAKEMGVSRASFLASIARRELER